MTMALRGSGTNAWVAGTIRSSAGIPLFSPTRFFFPERLPSKPSPWRTLEPFRGVKHVKFASNSAVEQIHFLKISDEVRSALMMNKPVVALESTIYTHGFPFPDNVTLALDLEKLVRQKGAVPATIGVVDGIATVGLSNNELIKLASAAGKPETMKISRRDIPYILGMVRMSSIFRLSQA
jgi:hypothetical protein